VSVLRNGAEKQLAVTLGQRDQEQVAANDDAPSRSEDSLSKSVGLRVAELSDATRQQFRIADGVNGVLVTAVKPGSAADEAGLRPGVVILQVDGAAVTTTASLKSKVADATKSGKEAVLLRLQIGSAKQFSALKIASKEG